MRFSDLQKYILASTYLSNSQIKNKDDFFIFYKRGEFNKNKKIIQDIVHNSIENLLGKDLLIVWGKKTAKKWFVHKVRLTAMGKKIAKEIITARQGKLPIK
jgi:hypothetical protein